MRAHEPRIAIGTTRAAEKREKADDNFIGDRKMYNSQGRTITLQQDHVVIIIIMHNLRLYGAVERPQFC